MASDHSAAPAYLATMGSAGMNAAAEALKLGFGKAPVFIREGKGVREPVRSMPGVARLLIDELVKDARRAAKLGIPAIALFPYVARALKREDGDEALNADNLRPARELAKWRNRLLQAWPQVHVEGVEANGSDPMEVGAELQVKARVDLGSLSPQDVEVQLFHGVVDSLGEIPSPRTVVMSHNGSHDGGKWAFKGAIPCRASGQYGYAVRVLPRHPGLANLFEPGLVCWG